MFPDITRDEVFRLETRRYWLRWPVPADAQLIARVQAETAEPAGFCLFSSTAAERLVEQWRSDNEIGRALHLTIVSKAEGRQPLGWVRIGPGCDGAAGLSVAVARDAGGPDIAVEAAGAVLATAILLGSADPVSLRSLSEEIRQAVAELGYGQIGRRGEPAAMPSMAIRPRAVLGCCLV